MNTNGDSNNAKNSRKKTITIVVVSCIALAAVGVFAYKTLSKIKNQEAAVEASQEQFAGVAQIAESLQAECQKSADRIVTATDANAMIAEYKKNVENCREVYFSLESKNKFRGEGMYPDIVVDIAAFIARTDKSKALEVLNFAKTLDPWEFSMGPVVCNSKPVVEAYIESFNSSDDKVCIKSGEYKEKLLPELKARNFSILSKSLSSGRVASMGTPDSEIGCPEKISTITKLAQGATSGDLKLEEEKIEGNENNELSFIFKAANEDKLILQFTPVNDCLELQTLIVPNLQANE